MLFILFVRVCPDVLYAVNGPNGDVPPLAFTVDIETGEILSTWDPYPKVEYTISTGVPPPPPPPQMIFKHILFVC